jgi:pimeloyl-ACP methyl ester carboxylesterase
MIATRKTLTLPKITLSYLEWSSDKEPLLLLHGLADQALVWSSLGDYLAEKYHIIAPDLRGHGESSKPELGYKSSDFIQDLEALMEHLGWSKAHILGHSWSAKFLPIWATQSPEKFQSLILVDPFYINQIPQIFKLTFPILYRVLPFLKLTQTFPSYEAIEQTAKQLNQYQGWTQQQQLIFQASIEQKADGTWGSKFVKQARNEVFEDVMLVAGLTQEITIPTLFIKPKKGINRTAWQLQPYHQYLTNLTIREVSGNHWPFLVAPEAFNKVVEEWLSA